MAELERAYISHLRKQYRDTAGKKLTCPKCKSESTTFTLPDHLFAHLAQFHSEQDLSEDNTDAREKLLQEAYQATEDLARNSSAPASPAGPESKTSNDLESGIRSSSVKAAHGSSSSSEGESQEPRPRGKRRFPGYFQQPSEDRSKQHARHRAELDPRPAPRTGIQIEDVDPDYVRGPPATNTPSAAHRNPQAKKLFDPTSTSKPAPHQRKPKAGPSHGSHGVGQAPEAARLSGPSSHAGPSSTGSPSSSRPSSSSSRGVLRLKYNPQWPTLVLQPESREISQEQLAAEVKSIYTGLTMVETKCIHIDKAQQLTPRSESTITNEHWQAMIALHRTLLHEHHDFFLASQHPSASPALKRLALKYSMPARMWKHGIHSFLELLRHRLPESLEYMLAFIYLAYQMMALLYETVGTFRNTWVECLGDLGRYRMAVEDEDVRDREIWAGVARSWYNKAADTNPAIGRLFHHLAILARPNMVQQLYLYNRSLTSVMPFMNARDSIVTIFDPVLSGNPPLQVAANDIALLHCHALLFKKKDLDEAELAVPRYIDTLNSSIFTAQEKWREIGSFTAIAHIGALYDFGNEANPIRFLTDIRRKTIQHKDPRSMPPGLPEDQSIASIDSLPPLDSYSQRALDCSSKLLFSTFHVALTRIEDRNVLPFIHVTLVFVFCVTELSLSHPDVLYVRALLNAVPWNELCSFIHTLHRTSDFIDENFKNSILFEEGGAPLPEDWMMRGLNWAFEYLPRTWFKDAAITEEEERYMERTSTMKARIDRIMSLMVQIAKISNRISFNPDTGRFHVVGEDVDMADDEGYRSEDSPQMEEIKENERRGVRAADLRTKYGKMIPNLDILKQPELVNIILDDSNMEMIIPHECMQALLDSANAHNLSSGESAAALHNIRTALNEYRNITIQDSSDRDLTRQYVGSLATFFQERPPQQERIDYSSPNSQRPGGIVNTLHTVARQNSDPMKKASRTATGLFSRTTTGLSEMNTAADDMDIEGPPADFPSAFDPADDRPAVVITDDRKVRAQVGKLGSAAIAGWMVKKWLTQARKSQEERVTSAKPMDMDQPIPVTAAG